MKRWGVLGVLVGAVGLLLSLTMGADRGDGTELVNGHKAKANEVLIKFRDASPPDIERAKMRGKIVHAEMIGGNKAYRFRSSEKNVAALLNLLAADPKVEYVEPNYILYADNLPNDPRYPELWGMPKISAPWAWDTSTGSPSVTVGVVDTGIDYNHPDFKRLDGLTNVWTAPYAFDFIIGTSRKTCPGGAHGYNAIRGTFDPMDDNNHGTHVSGTIGAAGNNGIGVAGVNWTASLMGLKFLNNQGSGLTSDAVNAIEFAIQAKLAGAANVRVLSNSWGGGKSTRTMLEEINRAYENDILFVCSAGNGYAEDAKNYYPATYNVLNMVVVAASDQDDYVPPFSNTGHWSVHLAAPGVDVLSTVRRKSYASYSGTSMAAPHVSGTAALIVSRWASQGFEVNVDQLRGIIINSVDIVDNEPPPPPNPEDPPSKNISEDLISKGRLNLAGAISVDPNQHFPDFVLRFKEGLNCSQSVVRPAKGKVAELYFDFTLTSYLDYEDDALEVTEECCGQDWMRPSFADLSVNSNPGPNDFLDTLNLPLGKGESITIRMRVIVKSSAPITQTGITIHALDPENSDAAGPYLYHNDTAYINITR